MREADVMVPPFATKYPRIIIIEKFIMRNHKTNQLLLFLPDNSDENWISMSQAKTRNGNPSSIAISENLVSNSTEM
jgi:hypothetical protein